MKIDKETLEYIVMQNEINAYFIVETIFYQLVDSSHGSLKRKDLLTEIRKIILSKGIDNVKEVETAIIFLLKKSAKFSNENKEIDLNKHRTTESKEYNPNADHLINLIEKSLLISETEKQAIFRVEDAAYKIPTLSGITDKAKWQYYSLAKAKLRILKSLNIPF